MSNRNDGPAAHQAIQCLPNSFLGFAVKSRSRFIEQENGRVLEEGAGNAQSLALAEGELHAPITDNRRKALGQVFYKVAAIGRGHGLKYFRIGCLRSPISNVFHDGAVKQ